MDEFTQKDVSANFDAADVQNNKAMGILAYISWLVLIPLFAAKESPFARFHVNQGLLLAIVEVVTVIICDILDGIPVIGWLFVILRLVISIVCLVFSILGIVSAAKGQAKEVPIIGGIRIIK